MRDESSEKRMQATMAMNEGLPSYLYIFLFEISYLPCMEATAATHFACICVATGLNYALKLYVPGHEIAPNTVANATKITALATKIQKLVAKLATRSL